MGMRTEISSHTSFHVCTSPTEHCEEREETAMGFGLTFRPQRVLDMSNLATSTKILGRIRYWSNAEQFSLSLLRQH